MAGCAPPPGRPAAFAWRAVGLAFCLLWALAVLLFPLQKHMPSGYVPVLAGVLVGLALAHGRVRGALSRRLAALSGRWFWILVLGVGLGLRLAAMAAWPQAPASDAAIYHARALDILAARGFGPTAFNPPGLPFLLAGWYRLTAPDPLAGYVLGALLGTATIALAWDVGRRALGPLAARWAAVLTAVMPTLVFTAARTETTTPLAFAVLAMGDLALVAAGRGWRAGASLVGLGLLLGMAALVKPIFLPVPLLLAAGWLALGQGRRALLRATVCLVLMAAVIAPWTWRNWRLLGAFVPVSTNGGSVLYHGTNPATDGMWSPGEPPPAGVDEVAHDRALRDAALRWIAAHPAAWCRLVLVKQAYMWGTSSTNIATLMNPALPPRLSGALAAAIKGAINVFWAALLVLCAAATLTTDVWGNRWLRPLVLFLLFTAAVHLVLEVQSRYHIPVIGVLVVIAAAGLARPAAAPDAPGRAAAAA